MPVPTYPAYDAYEESRYRPRRQSLSYSTHHAGLPYDTDPGMIYDEPAPMHHRQPSYQLYPPPRTMSRGPSYDDIAIRDGYYDDHPSLSTALTLPSMTPVPYQRPRRYSTLSSYSRYAPTDAYYRPSRLHIKFKRRNALLPGTGITFTEAQSYRAVAESSTYNLHDLHATYGCILLRVQWSGYKPTTYSIPVEEKHGRVVMQTLARRVARACVHYLQARMVPIPWDRIELHHLEEVSYGTWQPMLLTR